MLFEITVYRSEMNEKIKSYALEVSAPDVAQAFEKSGIRFRTEKVVEIRPKSIGSFQAGIHTVFV